MRSDWVSVADRWETIVEWARLRSRGEANPRRWTREPDVVGVASEAVFGRLTGRKLIPPVREGDDRNDRGIDFLDPDGTTIDVKGCTYWRKSSVLLTHRTDSRWASDIFVLVVFDMEGRRGRHCGWATRAELLAGPVKEWQRKGRCYTLPEPSLNPTLYLLPKTPAGAIVRAAKGGGERGRPSRG